MYSISIHEYSRINDTVHTASINKTVQVVNKFDQMNPSKHNSVSIPTSTIFTSSKCS